MPTTVGRPPSGTRFLDQWVMEHGESERRRVYGDPVQPRPEPITDEPGPRERDATTPARVAARDAAVSNAMGEAFVADPEPDPPDRDWAAHDVPPTSVEPETQSHAYRVREGDWRERHGMPRKRKTVPPSRTREGRRAAHIAKKAERLGISYADAERMTERRRGRRG